MKSLKEIIEDAIKQAKTSGQDVFIFDRGDEFTILTDMTNGGEGTLAYIVRQDGAVDLVDG